MSFKFMDDPGENRDHPRLGIRLVALHIYLCLTFIGGAWSSSVEYLQFRRLTPQDGLPSEQVLCIYEDSRAFLWLGTSDGLVRYDSHEFRIFRPDPKDPHSLANGNVTDIHEDSQGNLWIATLGGLDLWHRDTEQFSHFRHDPGDKNSLSDNAVQSLLLNPDGSLWVGTSGAGLNHLEPRSGKCTRFTPEESRTARSSVDSIQCLFRDRKGQIWIGSGNDGLKRFDPRTGHFQAYVHDPNDSRSLSHNHVSAIAEDAEGYLWVGTGNGISRLDLDRRFFERFSADIDDPDALQSRIVDAILMDRDGRVWVGTDGGGLSCFIPASGKFLHYRHSKYAGHTLASDVVRTLYQDRSGDFWIGHFPAGLSHANRLTAPFRVVQNLPGETNTLSDDHVMSFLEDPNGDLWVGTDNGGLNHWDQATGQWKSYRYDPHNPRSLGGKSALTLLRDHHGRLWVGSWNGGLNRFEPDTGTFHRYLPDPSRSHSLSSPHVWRLIEDPQHQLWVATSGGGLHRYLPEEDGFIHYRNDPTDPRSLNSDYVSSLLVTRDGTLWVGTTKGLARWVPSTQTWDRFQSQSGEPDTLSNNDVIDLLEDHEGMIWISTGGGGVNRLNPVTTRFETIQIDHGLPSNVLRGLLEDDDGMLWIGSNQGLARLDPHTHRIRIFDENDGLPGIQFSSNARLRLRSGELVFGTTQGFVKFDPRAIRKNLDPPPVVLTVFEVFNRPMLPGMSDSPLRQSITETHRLEIPARLSVLSFQFAALNYRSSERNQYRHRLEGFDEEWRKPGPERRATYTNLDPGRYRFRVKAANGDGVWNESGVNLEVVIIPPWWGTWWFRGAALLALLAAAVSIGWTISAYRSGIRLREAERDRQLSQEREKAALAVYESELKHRTLFETTSDAILLMRRDRFLDCNGQAPLVFGCRRDEILGATPSRFSPLIQPDGLNSDEKILEKISLALARKPQFFEWEYCRLDGTHFMTEVSLNCLELGGEILLQAIVRDITERKRTEEELNKYRRDLEERVQARTSELHTATEQLEAIFQATNVGIVVLRDRVIRQCNSMAEQIFGYESGELTGRPAHIWYPGETGKTIGDESVCEQCSHGEIPQRVQRLERKDGSTFWARLTSRALDPDDSTKGMVVVIEDITAERENLESLKKALERAEEADRLKSAFLATMSHELRTPLNSIIGFTGILMQDLAGPLNPEQRKQLEMVWGSARHLLALINDVLDISKIEAGQLEVTHKPFDLRASIKKVVEIVTPLAAKRDLALHLDMAPEISTIVGDQRRVEQVLLNLLNNAVKFTEKGEIRLTAEIWPLTAASSSIRISVSDTGIGIKTEDLTSLFQPFRQIDCGLSRSHEGTGLGLVICRKLAELMGGAIHAESEWGKGSTFRFLLPSPPDRRISG